MLMRRNAAITTNATETATGGNININAGTIVQLENSDITANAVEGKGGNIQINTQGIFRSLDSDITASSEKNVSGIVNITSLNVNQENSLQEQTSNFVNTEKLVANSCISSRNSQSGKFVISGNGGLAETPENPDIAYTVTQVQPVLLDRRTSTRDNRENIPAWKLGDPIIEAKELRLTPDGRIVLTTNDNHNVPNFQGLICQ
jgi:large exoprotein involved in heme utilization and adhesion